MVSSALPEASQYPAVHNAPDALCATATWHCLRTYVNQIIMTDLTQLDAVALAHAIRSKSVSPVDVVDAVLARIEQVNDKVLAYCTPTAELARASARTIEHRIAAGERV